MPASLSLSITRWTRRVHDDDDDDGDGEVVRGRAREEDLARASRWCASREARQVDDDDGCAVTQRAHAWRFLGGDDDGAGGATCVARAMDAVEKCARETMDVARRAGGESVEEAVRALAQEVQTLADSPPSARDVVRRVHLTRTRARVREDVGSDRGGV